ncbi:hypothetical protein C8Q77DRAFT_1113749 [Trametes polyzona]|nr:hypothetical protein C8Q77DRAFT_1113749 [Trametes polyzona]
MSVPSMALPGRPPWIRKCQSTLHIWAWYRGVWCVPLSALSSSTGHADPAQECLSIVKVPHPINLQGYYDAVSTSYDWSGVPRASINALSSDERRAFQRTGRGVCELVADGQAVLALWYPAASEANWIDFTLFWRVPPPPRRAGAAPGPVGSGKRVVHKELTGVLKPIQEGTELAIRSGDSGTAWPFGSAQGVLRLSAFRTSLVVLEWTLAAPGVDGVARTPKALIVFKKRRLPGRNASLTTLERWALGIQGLAPHEVLSTSSLNSCTIHVYGWQTSGTDVLLVGCALRD